MSEGREPAQCVYAFPGSSTLSSHISGEVGKIIHQVHDCQPSLVANYCNHARFAPKLFVIPSNHKPRAKVVQETDKKLALAYRTPKLSLKTLQFHDSTGHRVRSQRREAAIALLQVMNYYQDDATGRIGRLNNDGTFNDLSLKKLAKYAGLLLKRAKRAMRDIVRSGYLKVIRQFNMDDVTGKVTGLPSIRSFLPKFFIDLDVKGKIWAKWFNQRGWAKERTEKKLNKVDRKKSRAMMALIKGTIEQMGSAVKKTLSFKSVPSVESTQHREARIAHEKNLMSKALEMFNLNPSRSTGDYYKALLQSHPLK